MIREEKEGRGREKKQNVGFANIIKGRKIDDNKEKGRHLKWCEKAREKNRIRRQRKDK